MIGNVVEWLGYVIYSCDWMIVLFILGFIGIFIFKKIYSINYFIRYLNYLICMCKM